MAFRIKINDLVHNKDWNELTCLGVFRDKSESMQIVDALFENNRYNELNAIISERTTDIVIGHPFKNLSECREIVVHILDRFKEIGRLDAIKPDTLITIRKVPEIGNYLRK